MGGRGCEGTRPRGREGAGRLRGSGALRPLEAATVLGGETPAASFDTWPPPRTGWRPLCLLSLLKVVETVGCEKE